MGNGAFGPRFAEQRLRSMRRKNNPAKLPVGDQTGRCRHCGGQEVWDEPLAYGCPDCGSVQILQSQ